MNVGESKDFAYQGSVESWVVPNGGWYLLEAWGAQGGRYGGKGGYAKGCAKLKKVRHSIVLLVGKALQAIVEAQPLAVDSMVAVKE